MATLKARPLRSIRGSAIRAWAAAVWGRDLREHVVAEAWRRKLSLRQQRAGQARPRGLAGAVAALVVLSRGPPLMICLGLGVMVGYMCPELLEVRLDLGELSLLRARSL